MLRPRLVSSGRSGRATRRPSSARARTSPIRGFGPAVWYVYRYGSARPVGRWWTEQSYPWAVLDDQRRFVDLSSSLAEIVEAPVEMILGQQVEAFSNPDDPTARDDVEALWAEFRRAGQLDATLRFRRLDGTEREIEYHLVANAAGPGRHLATVREVTHEGSSEG